MIKKNVLKRSLPFPAKIPMHDIWLGFVSELYFKTIFLEEPLTLYRKHGNNVSATTNGVSHYSIFEQIQFRFNIVRYLPALVLRQIVIDDNDILK